jgi:hypothetical protein
LPSALADGYENKHQRVIAIPSTREKQSQIRIDCFVPRNDGNRND